MSVSDHIAKAKAAEEARQAALDAAMHIGEALDLVFVRSHKLVLRHPWPRQHLDEKPLDQRDLQQVDPKIRAAVKSAIAHHRWPLTILGSTGVGKTCASLCLLDRCFGVYFTAPSYHQACIDAQQERLATSDLRRLMFGGFVDLGKDNDATFAMWQKIWAAERCLFRAGLPSGTVHPAHFFGWLSKVELVVVDDYGLREDTRPTKSGALAENLLTCLHRREGKPMVVCSNNDLAGIGRLYGAPVESRLAGGTVVVVRGKDRRRDK